MTTIISIPQKLANITGGDSATFLQYMSEDNAGGRDTGQWSGMSIHEMEGRIIYALVRHYKPKTVLEIGTADGCGATHILSALEANNKGTLLSLDIDANAGAKIPDRLRHRWTLQVGDSLDAPLTKADFVFEDGAHEYEYCFPTTNRILKEVKPKVLIAHDLLSHKAYGDSFGVMKTWNELFGDNKHIVEVAFTGLGVKVF
jgi:predicted O-methyltransferase YrrM